jgi:DNA-binding response OmpR family regulator
MESVLPRASDANDTTERPSSRRILIVDDNRDAAETLGILLRLSGHEVHLAYTGAGALEVASRIRPEIGVLDIGIPDLSGYELAQRIRREAWGQRMTLIALTGWSQEDDKRRALAAGFDHHCTKPVDPADLERFF